ncbi:GDSL esterase/lipase At1g54790 isoform X1 [Ziziphus jujuba]|uniref:GDSL esterase/lipase At1g54790 isoform X1 n=1 Tax=Ziziphus jujuba TaxID=326968 RepID=A0A6P6FVV5_ZIZJJ|nr:GDSL esterase/lipase At1g54790 isoform X1 [Ziziphus jujuba]
MFDLLAMASKFLFLQIIIFSSIVSPLASSSRVFNYPAVFNFGDSNSDTGEMTSGLGMGLDLPYGEHYFKKPAGRACDGRLIVDFLMEAMGLPFLNPYLDSVGMPNFQKGCNFAAAGSTIMPVTPTAFCPFSFGIQVDQFLRFKSRVLELLPQNARVDEYIPAENFFKEGLYMFDIGQNDLAGAFYPKTLEEVLAWIPTVIEEFESGIKKLYDSGARNFWIHNTGPAGCLPQNIAQFQTGMFGKDKTNVNKFGCLREHNMAARVFNLELHALCEKLKTQYPDVNVRYVDIYSIKYDLIANHTKYGFESPIRACCGYGGGKLNYNINVACGHTVALNGTKATAKGCSNSAAYVSWDGIHYTQAANNFVVQRLLTGNYTDPPL